MDSKIDLGIIKSKKCLFLTSLYLLITLCSFVFLPTANIINYQDNFLNHWRGYDNQPIYSKLKLHKPNAIMIHHTGAKTSRKQLASKLRSLFKFSLKKNWGDIPYHFYIDRNGAVANGRSVFFVPDTNTTFDTTGYINIVLEGDFSSISNERPSQYQNDSLNKVISLLKSRYGIKHIVAHNDKAKTLCPGNIKIPS